MGTGGQLQTASRPPASRGHSEKHGVASGLMKPAPSGFHVSASLGALTLRSATLRQTRFTAIRAPCRWNVRFRSFHSYSPNMNVH